MAADVHHHGEYDRHHHHAAGPKMPGNRAMATDPVCGMSVDPATAVSTEHGGNTYSFCCDGCRDSFVKNPEKYLNATPFVLPVPGTGKHVATGMAGAARRIDAPVAPKGTIYTCPMHPEIRQEGPGSCPICGMALEPVMPTVSDEPNQELGDMTLRFWIATALAVPVFLIEMVGMQVGFRGPAVGWVQLTLATPAVLWAGWPFFDRAWASIRNRSLNMFTLIAMGIGVAWLYSTIAVLVPGIFPMSLRDMMDGTVPVYFEAAAVITALALLGQVLELRARERTSGAIKGLLNLAPKMARRIKADGSDEDVPLEHVMTGDRLRVRPGETVPVDGIVREGHGTIDESLVTGEPMPVTKDAGDALIGGTINQAGSLVIEAGKVGSETLLMRIVEMVAAAQRSRAPIQRLADQVSGWFVPLVIAVAVLAFIGWAFFGPEPRLAHGIVAAVSVLIIACPCALGLATPMSIMVGVGKGAQAGVLIRNAEALEQLEKIDTLVVDKTGTLTEGKPNVTAIAVEQGFSEAEVLRAAASLERASEHPIGRAIVTKAEGQSLGEPTHVETSSGGGISGMVDGKRVRVGNGRYLGVEHKGKGPVLVEIDGRYAGSITIADAIKTTTPESLAALRAEGIRVVMLTGDNEANARAIGHQLGITEIEAGVLPDRKGDAIARLKSQGRKVAMAGDGTNDAPALAAAEVGIAMGTGTDIAIESAGVTLLQGDLMGIVRARKLSRATMDNIRQNLFFAFIYNAAGVPVAAGVLYPWLGVLLSPAIAAAAMALSSVSVIGNALRLRATRLD